MIKKNDVIDVEILNLGVNGEGVARHDGIVIFVPYALPGELVKIQIINTKQKAYIGKIVEVLQPSKCRIKPLCPYFAKCGGCQLQQCEYNETLQFKRNLVQNAITHIGKLDHKVQNTVASERYYYRNKFAFPIDPITRKIAMFRPNSHKMVPIDNCYLQEGWCLDIINIFNNFLQKTDVAIYNEESGDGLIRHIVARGVDGKILITVVINGNSLPNLQLLIKMLSEKLDNFGLNININKQDSNVILSNDFVHIYGLKEIELCEYEIKYTINNASFMQINNHIKHAIYDKVLSEISANDVVIDAYSGAGLLTAIMSKKCKFAYGIEIVEPAVKSADNLTKINNLHNIKNICGDTTKELPKLVKNLKKDDNVIVVLDPPRKGCDKAVMNTIASVKPNKILYISCNPSTLARDLYNLCEITSDYEIKYIIPYDMFPNTKHVETLCCLQLKMA